MPYLLTGNAAQIFTAFKRSDFLQPCKDTEQIQIDIPRTFFLGTEKQANLHLKAWQKEKAGQYYTQGDMSAGNLQLILGNRPFKKEDEDDEEYKKNYACYHFAYIAKDKTPCGLMIAFRKDDPSLWMMGHVLNTPAAPAEREVVLLSRFNLIDPKNPLMEGMASSSVEPLNNDFIKSIGSRVIEVFIKILLYSLGRKIKINFERINLLLRYLLVSEDKATLTDPINCSDLSVINALFKQDDPVLDYLAQTDIHVPFALLQAYLSGDTTLFDVLKSIIDLPIDLKIKINTVNMAIVFYEEKTLEANSYLLKDYDFIKRFGDFMSHPIQIKLIPLMLKEKYSEELMKSILKESAYYQAIHILWGTKKLTKSLPSLFEQENKLEALRYLHELKDESCKKLCLIFWYKDTLTLQGYKEIVAAAKEYPLMPETLVYLDKHGVVSGGMGGLKTMALTPESHLKESIKYHFFNEDEEQAYLEHLNCLTLSQLEAVSKALHTLRELNRTNRSEYRFVLESSSGGEALRIFLPQIATIKNSAHRDKLIDALYQLVNQGMLKQVETVALVKELHYRFLCVKHLQDLKFPNEVISWAAQTEDKKSHCFRQVIIQVDAQCKDIYSRLPSSGSNNAMLEQWKKKEGDYRKNLYQIAYDALTKPNIEEAKKQLQALENEILDIVDPPIKSTLYQAFIVITNIVISLLTLGLANYIKEKRTGIYWFFTQSVAGENIRALNKEIIDSMQSSIDI